MRVVKEIQNTGKCQGSRGKWYPHCGKMSMLQGIAILGKQCVISVENGGTVLLKAPYSGRSIGCSATKWVEEESEIVAENSQRHQSRPPKLRFSSILQKQYSLIILYAT